MATKEGNKGAANKGGNKAPTQQAGGNKGRNDNQNKERKEGGNFQGGKGGKGGNFQNKYPNQPVFEAEQKAFDAVSKTIEAKISQIKSQQAAVDVSITEKKQLETVIDGLRKKLQEEGIPAEKAKLEKKTLNDQVSQKNNSYRCFEKRN